MRPIFSPPTATRRPRRHSGACVARIPTLALLALTGLPATATAQDPAAVDIRAVEVARGVWMLTGQGGNMGLAAGPDGVFLVDDQYAPLTPRIVAAVAALGHGAVDFVLNTHWHGDHTGGNENLGRAGALIVAHENVRERMSTEQFIARLDRAVPPSPAGALPVVTFTEAVTFHLNGDEIHAFHVAPAHTDGDAIVHFRRADVLHMGDVYFNGAYPFVDLSSGGDADGVIVTVERALELAGPATRVIPGHGELSGRAELEAYHAMLVDARGRVRQLMEEGLGRDAVIAAKPTAHLDAAWGGGFIAPDQFVGFLFDSLAR
ncbi:MAG TPA: MBL fold metallo-hydrolase [Longimicrobiales bacterium]|nr:MBL fold metallo-hydrolase [Longimicrobiales bacterium]